MRWAHPEYAIYIVFILAGLAVFYLWVFKVRRRDLEKFAQQGLLA